VHQRIAEVIVEQFPAQAEAQPEVVAHHYTEAGLGQPAVDYWERAGRRSVTRSACTEALAHFNKALEVLRKLPETPERIQRELGLQVALGFAIPPLKGWGAPEGKQAFGRALKLSQDMPDSPLRFGAQWGLWTVHTVQTEHKIACHFAEECVALGQRVADAGLLVEGYLILGISLFFLGDLAAGRTQLEACIAAYDSAEHADHAFVYGQDPKAGGVTLYLPPALCALGYPDLGLSRGEELLNFARALAHPHTLAFALCGMAWAHLWRQEWSDAQRVAEELIARSSEQSFAFWESAGRCIAGSALVHQRAASPELLQRGLTELKAMGMGNFWTSYLPWRAEAAATVGRPQEGLSALADCLAALGQTDQRYAEAELYRIQGMLLQQLPSADVQKAEVCYLKAIEVARHQQTKLLELRAATRLCRLWQSQGKRNEAHDLLAPVYNWFTEGFDTKDLIDAKALLQELEKAQPYSAA
jgi:predicted ATPase